MKTYIENSCTIKYDMMIDIQRILNSVCSKYTSGIYKYSIYTYSIDIVG